jgi:hypothetical protein
MEKRIIKRRREAYIMKNVKCNWGDWCVILVFRDRGFFFPNIFCWFLCAVNRDEDIVRESFSVKFILHSSWYTPLVYVLWTFFPCGLLCLFFCFFFLSTRCCQYYMNYWTHPPFNCCHQSPQLHLSLIYLHCATN